MRQLFAAHCLRVRRHGPSQVRPIRATIGANFTYQRNLQVCVAYMGYFGNAEVVSQREFRALTDRDQL